MNKHRIAQISSGIVLLGVSVSVSLSLAWFYPTTKIGDKGQTNVMPIDGSSSSAYFAYGDGTAEKPYGIKSPRHLYNLAWLQYINHFKNEQKYFELADNVDMDGWTLPPIGTEDCPFVSQFNGKGYVVSNLTVSNNFDDYNVHPSAVSGFNNSNYKQPHILGMFGVVGNYNGDVTDYNSAVNTLTDTGIYNATIKTAVNDSLMGIAAGYVDADLKNVVVDSSTLNVASSSSTAYKTDLTTNVSDYSLVGYTTKKKTIKKASKNIYGINISNTNEFNATEDGNANGWGGSIDMKSVLQRLQTIRNNYTTGSRFAYKKTYNYHNGVKDANPTSQTNSTNNRTYAYANDTAHKEWGHFHFMADSDSDRDYYALMGGGHYETDNYYEYTVHNGYKITDGTNYLSFDTRDESIVNQTNSSSATIWHFNVGTSAISYSYSGTTYYLYNNNGTLTVSDYNQTNWTITSDEENGLQIRSGNYYLVYANGWTLYNPNSTANGYYIISDGTHYLAAATLYHALGTTNIENAVHFGFNSTNECYYPLDNTNYYLGYYGESYPVQIWSDGDYYYHFVDESDNEISAHYGTGYLRAISKRGEETDYYIAWSGADETKPWTATNKNNADLMTIQYIEQVPPSLYLNITDFEEVTGPDEYLDHTTEGMNYDDDDVTYFPLSTVNDTTDFNPSDNNTAYVVAGSSIKSSTNTYSASLSNVRFSSYYDISGNISNDYNSSSGTFTHIYTVNDNLAREEITNKVSEYERLQDSMTALGNVMKGGSKTYGLHFMESTISMDALTTATYIKVNNEEHENYQLPVNSIDFHLKEFGYINFIAGSYFVQTNGDRLRNDSFFSIYQIERLQGNKEKINRILEIKNVYQHTSKNKTYSYVYELSDGSNTFYTKPYRLLDSEGHKQFLDGTTYSENVYENSLPSGYTKVFNTSRIKKNNIARNTFDKHVYYFEIPMNDGEFCLGSVEGGIGSYLMYLDIGANAAKTYRTTFYEHFSLLENTYSYPLGVALVELPATFTTGTAVVTALIPAGKTEIDYADSVCMRIEPSALGTFKIDRGASGDVTLNRSNTTLAPPIYAGDSITKIHEGSSAENIELTALESHSYDIKRMQYYDYMINTDTLVVTTFTDTKDGDGTYVRTISQSLYSGNVVDSEKLTNTYTYDSETDQRDSMKIYRDTKGSSNGVRYTSEEIINQTTLPIATSNLSNTAILTLQIVQDGDGAFSDETILTVAIDESMTPDMYYTFSSYETTLTTESGDTLTVTVSVYESNVTITVTNHSTGATSSKTLTNNEVVNGTNVTGSGQIITITQP